MMGKYMHIKEQGKHVDHYCIAAGHGCDHSCFSEVFICLLHCELKLSHLNILLF